jgi:hypothetical protein
MPAGPRSTTARRPGRLALDPAGSASLAGVFVTSARRRGEGSRGTLVGSGGGGRGALGRLGGGQRQRGRRGGSRASSSRGGIPPEGVGRTA